MLIINFIFIFKDLLKKDNYEQILQYLQIFFKKIIKFNHIFIFFSYINFSKFNKRVYQPELLRNNLMKTKLHNQQLYYQHL
jgi:hypothetical protein